MGNVLFCWSLINRRKGKERKGKKERERERERERIRGRGTFGIYERILREGRYHGLGFAMNTSSHLSSTHSSPSEFGDETSMMETTNWQRIPPPMQATSPPINGSSAPSSIPAKAQTLPLQKRRRVTRACDECRRKKIKCDGKQPDRKSTRLNSSHLARSRMPSSA